MNFGDIEMLKDYEKDARLAASAYISIETETVDPDLRFLIHRMADEAAKSQKKAIDLLLAKGARP